MSAITTHVLDTGRGIPAAGVPVELSVEKRGAWENLGTGVTDENGRLRSLLDGDAKLHVGTYRLVFDTNAYFQSLGQETFYPEVTVVFSVREPGAHYHVPLLVTPWSYTTYRGS